MIDSHCHLADPAFREDLEAVVHRALEAGVTGALCVIALEDPKERSRIAAIDEHWPGIRLAVGVHPHTASVLTEGADALPDLLGAAHEAYRDVRAVGEIGLDYHYDRSPRAVQRACFRTQVRVARRLGLPVVVHTREADDDTVAILAEEGGGDLRGVVHCFSGTERLAEQAIAMGLMLSFSGMVTFPRADAIREVARATPADRLLVETDCPYLAPVPMRGRRNEPAWVVRTAAAVAGVRGIDVALLDRIVAANFDRLFGARQAR